MALRGELASLLVEFVRVPPLPAAAEVWAECAPSCGAAQNRPKEEGFLITYSDRLDTAMLVVKSKLKARRMRFSRRPRWDMVK